MCDFNNSLKYGLISLEIGKIFDNKHDAYSQFMLEIDEHFWYIYDIIGENEKSIEYMKKVCSRYPALYAKDKEMLSHYVADLGISYYKNKDYKKAVEKFHESLSFQNHSDECTLIAKIDLYINLAYKKLGKEYEDQKILPSIKSIKGGKDYELNFHIYELLEKNSYLKSAYNKLQEKISEIDDKLSKKFLSYPIPKEIVEEYNKIFKNK